MLVWVVVAAAVTWVVSSAVSSLLYLQVGATLFEGTGIRHLVRWSQLISLVAQPLTLGGSAVYVVFAPEPPVDLLVSRATRSGIDPPWTSGRVRSSIPRRSRTVAACGCAVVAAWPSAVAPAWWVSSSSS